MFIIDEDNTTIKMTRGQSGFITFSALTPEGDLYTFKRDDIIRLNITKEGRENMIVMSIDTRIEDDTNEASIFIASSNSTIGPVINKPVNYWYDIELNPDTSLAQMLLGYDDNGPKIFRLYPESVKEEEEDGN